MPLGTDVEQQLSAGLRAITCLSDLAKLRVYTPTCELSAVVWHALATLTALTELHVECGAPCAEHIMLLTSCKELEILGVEGELPETEYLFELLVESEVSSTVPRRADQRLSPIVNCIGSTAGATAALNLNNQFVGLWVTMLVALRQTLVSWSLHCKGGTCDLALPPPS